MTSEMWIQHRCLDCRLAGVGRQRLMVENDRPCPRCGGKREQIGDPFPVEEMVYESE